MNTVSSRDGTTIAYDRVGDGPAVILVDGALSVHSSGGKSELAELMAPHFTVYGYDRRGRGASGDTLPYAVDREIEDIGALIDQAGGSAFLYGHSSGATLAMHAALQLGGRVRKLAMYEPPYNDDPDAQNAWSDYLTDLAHALAAGRRDDAVALFMRFVGTPAARSMLCARRLSGPVWRRSPPHWHTITRPSSVSAGQRPPIWLPGCHLRPWSWRATRVCRSCQAQPRR